MTRQRLKQIRYRESGMCMICGEPAISQSYCGVHKIKNAIRNKLARRAKNSKGKIYKSRYPWDSIEEFEAELAQNPKLINEVFPTVGV